VIVVGAGMAGLVAAYELQRAGHDPIVLEARRRVGGRIETHRDGWPAGLAAELGAMRIPCCHALTLAYVEHFGLPLLPFVMHNPQGYAYLGGRKQRLGELTARPALMAPEAADGQAVWPGHAWELLLTLLRERLAREGERAWDAIDTQYCHTSLRALLQGHQWSEEQIEAFGLLYDQEAEMHVCCLDLLREELGGYFGDMVTIQGGMDRLPLALAASLGRRLRLGARVVAVEQDAASVTIHYRDERGPAQVTGDRAILTLPFPVLRHVDVLQPFSPGKQRAIRQLYHDAACKIYLHCTRRFWEEDDGIYGGGSVTDLPIRHLYYPEQGRDTGQGLLLASYTWAQDAHVWGALPEEERIGRAVADVARLHPQIRSVCEGGISKVWHQDPYAGAAFALFAPGQRQTLHAHTQTIEGRFHFAGEHTSLAHGWIQGAIQSGLRAALEVHLRA
jgi:monoamine oxidase